MPRVRYSERMLVEELPAGPVDIVGDVHGEIDALRLLLDRLGYAADGRHPDGRRLIFVGDVVDRGSDSPAVARLVRNLRDAGRAWCVLGNHELNILRGDEKDGNAWFFGKRDVYPNGVPTDEVLADDAMREEFTEFFTSLPLALEREDLRVVHACWDDRHADAVRHQSGAVTAVSDREEEKLRRRLGRSDISAVAKKQWESYDLSDPDTPVPMLPELAEMNVRSQNEHPVKVMTSGKEGVADEPWYIAGRWRLEQRLPWWDDYEGPMTVVGHYWRSPVPRVFTGKGRSLFGDTAPTEPLGRGHVMCVDYSIGRRNRERALDMPRASDLGAYRWPEARVVFAGA